MSLLSLPADIIRLVATEHLEFIEICCLSQTNSRLFNGLIKNDALTQNIFHRDLTVTEGRAEKCCHKKECPSNHRIKPALTQLIQFYQIVEPLARFSSACYFGYEIYLDKHHPEIDSSQQTPDSRQQYISVMNGIDRVVESGRVDVYERMIEWYPDQCHPEMLVEACDSDNIEMVKFVVDRYVLVRDVDLSNDDDDTVIEYHLFIQQAFVKAFDVCSKKSVLEISKYLISEGADPLEPYTYFDDDEDEDFPEYAIENALKHYLCSVKFLLSLNCRMPPEALSIAIQNEAEVDLVVFLVEKLHKGDLSECPTLLDHVPDDRPETAFYLMQHKAPVITCMHVLANFAHRLEVSLVAALLDSGAWVNAYYGLPMKMLLTKNPEDDDNAAAEQKRLKIFQMFYKAGAYLGKIKSLLRPRGQVQFPLIEKWLGEMDPKLKFDDPAGDRKPRKGQKKKAQKRRNAKA